MFCLKLGELEDAQAVFDQAKVLTGAKGEGFDKFEQLG